MECAKVVEHSRKSRRTKAYGIVVVVAVAGGAFLLRERIVVGGMCTGASVDAIAGCAVASVDSNGG